MTAVAKRGSAKDHQRLQPTASDGRRCGDPTTRKKASCILRLQPDDRGEAAEDFMLAAFHRSGSGGATGLGRNGSARRVMARTSLAIGASREACSAQLDEEFGRH